MMKATTKKAMKIVMTPRMMEVSIMMTMIVVNEVHALNRTLRKFLIRDLTLILS